MFFRSASNRHDGPKIVLALLAVYLIWGTTYLATRFAVASMPPILMIAARYLTAGTILYIMARFTGGTRPTLADWRGASIFGISVMGICNGVVALVADRVPTGSIACIFATGPFVLAIVSWIAGTGRQPGLREGLGMVAGFGGVFLLTGMGGSSGETPSWICSALLLFATLSWAIGTVWTSKSGAEGSLVMRSSLQMICGGVFSLIFGTFTGEWSGFNPSSVTGSAVAALAYLVFFGTILAFLSYNYLLRSTTVSIVASHAYVNPLVAMMAGVVVLGERFTIVEAASASLILSAVFVSLGNPRQSRWVPPFRIPRLPDLRFWNSARGGQSRAAPEAPPCRSGPVGGVRLSS
jgi:drug/metabolite transporter (DMT)-like permease